MTTTIRDSRTKRRRRSRQPTPLTVLKRMKTAFSHLPSGDIEAHAYAWNWLRKDKSGRRCIEKIIMKKMSRSRAWRGDFCYRMFKRRPWEILPHHLVEGV